MTVQTSYPGIYIQELPNLVHTITPSPTSIAVFVGYTHPLPPTASDGSLPFGKPIQLFSFADYQSTFGGFFSSPWQADYVGQAVFQFFQNGGQTCFVVGLQTTAYFSASAPGVPLSQPVSFAAASLAVSDITFTAKQPVGLSDSAGDTVGIEMNIAFTNVQSSTPDATNDTADIVITYGSVVETYRKVLVTNVGTALQNSNLVGVSIQTPPPATPAQFPVTGGPFSLTYPSGSVPPTPSPTAQFTVINPADFTAVFTEDAPLDKVPVFNLLAMPGITPQLSGSSVVFEAIAYCERKRAFYIMDTPSSDMSGYTADELAASASSPSMPLFPVSTNAAVYFPWLITTDPVTQQPAQSPPSGFVAGIYGREDDARGVWKSPAGIETTLVGTTGVVPLGIMNDHQQGLLNTQAVDCLRQFPGIGTVVFGARTTAGANPALQQWKYVAVRRMALFIEQTLYASLTWAVFEGNAAPLWSALTQEVAAFMLSLFRQGAFAGTTPSEAFVVKCDSTTTTPTDVANGTVNILVGFAPLVPAEFVVVQIAQIAGQAQS